MSLTSCENGVAPPHPRVLGWFGTTALAMGGSNQMIFLITALFVIPAPSRTMPDSPRISMPADTRWSVSRLGAALAGLRGKPISGTGGTASIGSV